MTEPTDDLTSLDIGKRDDKILKTILTITNRVQPPVYAPSDDSLLMIEAIKPLRLQGKRVLDMGTGSGTIALYCAMRGADVTASDVDESAIAETATAAKKLGLQVKSQLSDIFSSLPARFDLILFNPPYLPSAACEDRSVDGGPNGVLVADRFLEDLPAHLEQDGCALLLLSSVNDIPSLKLRHSNLTFSVAARQSLFFEELQVLRVRLRD